jgi:nucleoid DNA-binding protein
MCIDYKKITTSSPIASSSGESQIIHPIPICNRAYSMKEFAKYLEQNYRGSYPDIIYFSSIIFKGMESLLKEGKSIKIDDFGTFSISLQYKNISATKTAKAHQIVEVKKVLLKTSKRLKTSLNNGKFKLCK